MTDGNDDLTTQRFIDVWLSDWLQLTTEPLGSHVKVVSTEDG